MCVYIYIYIYIYIYTHIYIYILWIRHLAISAVPSNNINTSIHSGSCRIKFLVLGEGPTDDINDCVGAAERKFNSNIANSLTKFCLSLYCDGDNNYHLCEWDTDL